MDHVVFYWRYKDTTSRFLTYTFLYYPCFSIPFYAINIITTSLEHEKNDCFEHERKFFLNTNNTNFTNFFEHEENIEHERTNFFWTRITRISRILIASQYFQSKKFVLFVLFVFKKIIIRVQKNYNSCSKKIIRVQNSKLKNS